MATRTEYQSERQTATAVIAASGTLSAAVACGGWVPVGVITPAAWTAGDITFDASWDGGTTYAPLYTSAAEVKVATAIIATAEARYFSLDPANWHGVTNLKIRSGVNGTTVAQAAERTLTVVFARVN